MNKELVQKVLGQAERLESYAMSLDATSNAVRASALDLRMMLAGAIIETVADGPAKYVHKIYFDAIHGGDRGLCVPDDVLEREGLENVHEGVDK